MCTAARAYVVRFFVLMNCFEIAPALRLSLAIIFRSRTRTLALFDLCPHFVCADFARLPGPLYRVGRQYIDGADDADRVPIAQREPGRAARTARPISHLPPLECVSRSSL